ncbi:uncharacterized protein LOC135388167 [Ornithodoros turicata]|uniref:uncharacterized protein LOC135388167 n=1 Tax=Ornithodoros turicata TaxID=34597 RepID=UPI003138E374
MSTVSFPVTGWIRDLSKLPKLPDDSIESFSSSQRNVRRSYNFCVEQYVVTSSIHANYTRQGEYYVKALCYKSKKKTQDPYLTVLCFDQNAVVRDGACDCPAGKRACNHQIGVLRTVGLLQQNGFSEAPPQLSCTDLPQQWGVPRGRKVPATSVQNVNWRRVQEGGRDDSIKMRLYESLCVTPAAAREVEKNTRQQRNSKTWLKERSARLTASNFGAVFKRATWSRKGLDNMLAQKDISRVRAVKYGVENEDTARDRYKAVLHSLDRNITVSPCGLLVPPSQPWLGATPDGIVFDPKEETPHGILEIKCPYSLRSASLHDLSEEAFFSVVSDHENEENVMKRPMLHRDHDYYYQILGQMAVSGLRWGDFVVYSKDFILVERIPFSECDWARVEPKLTRFYFDTLLPVISGD